MTGRSVGETFSVTPLAAQLPRIALEAASGWCPRCGNRSWAMPVPKS